MKLAYSYFLVVLMFNAYCIELYSITFNNCGITTRLYPGGRFGDCVLSTIKAKWLSYINNIPFYFKSFANSSVLQGSKIEKNFGTLKNTYFKNNILLKHAGEIEENNVSSLFLVDVRTVLEVDLYEKCLLDEQFGGQIVKMLQPVVPIKYMDLPQDKITVAIHVRKGSWVDKPLFSVQNYQGHEPFVQFTNQVIPRNNQREYNQQESVTKLTQEKSDQDLESEEFTNRGTTKNGKHKYSDQRWPTKFPPDQYYIDQIKKLSELLDHKPLYVFIFSDCKKPKELTKKYQNAIELSNIEFCTYEKNVYAGSLVHDFYNMARFDCLIRSSSHFSYSCQLFGHHSIVIYPTSATWQGNKLIMDQITIVQSNNKELSKYVDTSEAFIRPERKNF